MCWLIVMLLLTIALLAWPLLKRAITTTALLLSQINGDYERSDYKIDGKIDQYNSLQNDSKASAKDRNSNYVKLVNTYYELSTTFYEWGWRTSFHFAHRLADEDFSQSIKRHEYQLASHLHLRKGEKVLDCGCGIGGPYRNIARFTGCDVTGITISGFQVKRANQLNRQMKLESQCRSLEANFMKIPFADNHFDGIYAIEATCHAPDRVAVFKEILRVLKPGRYFACYEWCLTDKYNADNANHRRIKKEIEEGDGLPDMATTKECADAFAKAGFDVVEVRDCVYDPFPGGDPWYEPLSPSWYPLSQRFQFNPVGEKLVTYALKGLEAIRLAPVGTSKVQRMLMNAQKGLVAGGKSEIFTPMYLMVGRKPISKKQHHQ